MAKKENTATPQMIPLENDGWEIFCQEVVRHNNLAKAYRVAYPDATRASAQASACRLLLNVRVQARIEELKKDLLRNSKVLREQLVSELSDMGFSNLDISSMSHSDKIKALAELAKILGYGNGADSSKANTDDIDTELSRAIEQSQDRIKKRNAKS